MRHGEGEDGYARRRCGGVDSLAAGGQCGAGGQDVVDDEHVAVGKLFGATRLVGADGVEQSLVSRFARLRRVVAHGDEIVGDGDTADVGEAAGYLFRLVVAAPPQLRGVEGHVKIILINNGGGGIFRFINATKHLAVRDEYLYGNIHIPAEELCRGFGYHYFKASDEPTLRAELRKFISDSETPSLLEIVTPAGISADILDKLLN